MSKRMVEISAVMVAWRATAAQRRNGRPGRHVTAHGWWMEVHGEFVVGLKDGEFLVHCWLVHGELLVEDCSLMFDMGQPEMTVGEVS